MFTSNKLDELGQYLQVGRKLSTHGFDTWLGCMSGDMKAWDLMCRYNKQDVVLLEKVYLKLRPWIDNHPSRGLIDGRPEACPKCGAVRQMQKAGFKMFKNNRTQRYQCQGCGGYSLDIKRQPREVEYTN